MDCARLDGAALATDEKTLSVGLEVGLGLPKAAWWGLPVQASRLLAGAFHGGAGARAILNQCPSCSDWWITIRLDACRTRDELIQARSAWSAGWLYRYLHPHIEVLSVRPVSRNEES